MNVKDDWVKDITIEMIPEQYQDVANRIGVGNLIKLSEVMGGHNVYIPKKDFFTRTLRDTLIKKEFNGYNYKHLATKYNLSEITIRRVVSDNGQMEGQESLF